MDNNENLVGTLQATLTAAPARVIRAVSPTVSAVQVEGGYEVTITDAEGDTVLNLLNGEVTADDLELAISGKVHDSLLQVTQTEETNTYAGVTCTVKGARVTLDGTATSAVVFIFGKDRLIHASGFTSTTTNTLLNNPTAWTWAAPEGHTVKIRWDFISGTVTRSSVTYSRDTGIPTSPNIVKLYAVEPPALQTSGKTTKTEGSQGTGNATRTVGAEGRGPFALYIYSGTAFDNAVFDIYSYDLDADGGNITAQINPERIMLAPLFNPKSAWAEGAYSIYGRGLYRHEKGTAAGTAWDAGAWTNTSAAEELRTAAQTQEDITGCRRISFLPGVYIDNSGETADITALVEDANYRAAAVACSPGDAFTVTATGGNLAQAYAFIDGSGNVLERFGGSGTITGAVLTAPADAAYLIINDKSGSLSYYGKTARTRLEALEGLYGSMSRALDWSGITAADTVCGWVKGAYAADRSISTNTTQSICYTGYFAMGEEPVGGAEYMVLTIPRGKSLVISEYSVEFDSLGGKTSTRTRSITAAGQYVLHMEQGKEYTLHYTGLATGSLTCEDYLTADFISQLKVETFGGSLSGKRRKTGDFEWFTVQVDRPMAFGEAEAAQAAEEVECVLRLPDSYSPEGTPTRLVLMCHGSTGYIDISTGSWYANGSGWRDFCDSLLAAGYALFDANVRGWTGHTAAQVGFAIGSPLYVNVLKKAYNYIVEHYNVHPQIFAHGTSMGGVGASAFSHMYPELVLAESSFAGRDILLYIREISTDGDSFDDRYALAFGYADKAAMVADKYSHLEGCAASLSLLKVDADGSVSYPPDRETDTAAWLQYYAGILGSGRTTQTAVETCIGRRSVPYKAWNSWKDDADDCYLERVLKKAYQTGSACPYYIVEYAANLNYGHGDMSYGEVDSMRTQLVKWFKRWE